MMMFKQQFAGIEIFQVSGLRGEYLLFRGRESMRTLSSSPWGGGFGMHTCLVNRQVNKNYNEEEPIEEMNVFLRKEGLQPDQTASMLTAASLKDVGSYQLAWGEQGAAEGLEVQAWVTVGLSNKARSGHELPITSIYPGTINSIILINGALTDAAMVNAVITATEAKTAALQDLGVRIHGHEDGKLATGTTTDAVLIAVTQQGRLHQYAGTATQLGYLIGRTVYESVMKSGQTNLNSYAI
jgi:adenosylcobinamide hydrolase